MVAWLDSLPGGVLFLGWLVIMLAIAAGSRWALGAFVPADERNEAQRIAAPLMPALGATFAVLMALTLAGEAAHQRTAQDLVSNEAADASRLAWAATSPGVASAPVHAALADYLRAVRAHEWDGGAQDDPAVAAALATLERTVRSEAGNAAIGTPASTELLASIDGLTTARRARLAAADEELPLLYALTLLISGVALVVNASALALGSGRRTAALVTSLAVVVGASMALLFAITAPFDGAVVVSGQPIDLVIRDLQAGFFNS